MGTEVSAAVDTTDEAPRARLRRVPCWFAAWEQRLTRFGDDGELARLNRDASSEVGVSGTLAGALEAALAAARWTDGIVTPTLHDALVGAGYDRTFDEVSRRASSPAGARDGATRDFRDVRLDEPRGTVARPPGLRLDLGGTAKGWSADRAASHLGRLAPAIVDAGGDVAISGPRRDGGPWLVTVASPAAPGEVVALLAVTRGGVATSGRDRRRWQVDGVWRHHVIDPRTGQPAATDVLSATVVARSAWQAEVAAKMVLVLGRVDGLAWLQAQPGCAGLVIDDDERVTATLSLDPYLVA